MALPSMISPPEVRSSFPTATISPARTWMSPPGISPSAESIVKTCAPRTTNSPRPGNFAELRSGDATLARFVACVPQAATPIDPNAAMAPRNPRRLIVFLSFIALPQSPKSSSALDSQFHFRRSAYFGFARSGLYAIHPRLARKQFVDPFARAFLTCFLAGALDGVGRVARELRHVDRRELAVALEKTAVDDHGLDVRRLRGLHNHVRRNREG